MKDKKYRGSQLDKAIEEICQEYVQVDPRVGRLTRSLVQRKLGLKSRSTLIGKRAEIIDYYIEEQRKNFNITKSGVKRRSLEEKINSLKEKNEKLRKERDQAIADYVAILNGLKMKGIDIQDVFYPIFNPEN